MADWSNPDGHKFGQLPADLARICDVHPTLSDAVREAALSADKRATHLSENFMFA
jgi:dihydrolipoamide dehydrogenase